MPSIRSSGLASPTDVKMSEHEEPNTGEIRVANETFNLLLDVLERIQQQLSQGTGANLDPGERYE